MTEKELEQFPSSESARKMLSYVTQGFYDKSYVGKWLFQVMGLEYDEAVRILEELPKQFFPETATWGLMYHEIKWGLPVREHLEYEERRRLIYQKRDLKSPMTPYKMEQYLKNAVGFEVHVSDVNDAGKFGFLPEHPNVFKLDFIGDGTLDAATVKTMVNRLKQSHTSYLINDRIIIVLDNRKLEKSTMPGMTIRARFFFWKDKAVDEGWKLDENVTGILQKLQIRLKQKIEILVPQEKAEASIIVKKNEWYLNGVYRLDGSKKLNAKITEEVL